MGAREDYSADAAFADALRRAYRGRHALDDALWWHEHPDDPAPSGAPSPRAPLDALRRAAYARTGGADEVAALAAAEEAIAADRVELERAIAEARAAPAGAPVGSTAPVATAGERARALLRRPAVRVLAVATVLVAVVGGASAIRGVTDADGPGGATTTSPAPSGAVTAPPTGTATLSTGTARPSTAPGATKTADPFAYAGPATCTSLLDLDTQSWLITTDREPDTSDRGRSGRPLPEFAATGLVCAFHTADASPRADGSVLFAYAPLDAGAAVEARDRFTEDGGYALDERDGVTWFTGADDRVAVGDDFWAWSLLGEGDVLDEVVAHAPERAGLLRTDLQSDVYVTSEGIGDIRLGSSARGSDLVEWEQGAYCPDGIGDWRAAVPFGHDDDARVPFRVATEDGTPDSPVGAIFIYSPDVPTKSGVRVGDPVDAVRELFPDLSDQLSLDGDRGTIRFVPTDDGERVRAIIVTPRGSDRPMWGCD